MVLGANWTQYQMRPSTRLRLEHRYWVSVQVLNTSQGPCIVLAANQMQYRYWVRVLLLDTSHALGLVSCANWTWYRTQYQTRTSTGLRLNYWYWVRLPVLDTSQGPYVVSAVNQTWTITGLGCLYWTRPEDQRESGTASQGLRTRYSGRIFLEVLL